MTTCSFAIRAANSVAAPIPTITMVKTFHSAIRHGPGRRRSTNGIAKLRCMISIILSFEGAPHLDARTIRRGSRVTSRRSFGAVQASWAVLKTSALWAATRARSGPANTTRLATSMLTSPACCSRTFRNRFRDWWGRRVPARALPRFNAPQRSYRTWISMTFPGASAKCKGSCERGKHSL